jgi:hypothetical protein
MHWWLRPGFQAADFAALSQPSNSREYIYLHHRLRVGAGDQLLDVALGSGHVNVGEAEFRCTAVELERGQLRDGLPLRAVLNVVGFLARKPEGA